MAEKEANTTFSTAAFRRNIVRLHSRTTHVPSETRSRYNIVGGRDGPCPVTRSSLNRCAPQSRRSVARARDLARDSPCPRPATDFITTALSGYELLADPQLNKGTAFSEAERDAFDLQGLLPPNVLTLHEQVSHRLQAFRGFETHLERYALRIIDEPTATEWQVKLRLGSIALAEIPPNTEGFRAAILAIIQESRALHRLSLDPTYLEPL